MKYGLARLFNRPPQMIEISEAEFFTIRAARKHFLTLLDIEEKFDIAIESYFDFERTRIDLGFSHMLAWDLPHSQLAVDIRIVNRRRLSLLAAAMLYMTSRPTTSACYTVAIPRNGQALRAKGPR